MNTVRFIQKTISELENIDKIEKARNYIDNKKNSANNSFVYNTNSKNFVVNHVTQSLIPASQRVNVAHVPYNVRGLRDLINAGHVKVPHAPSMNLPINVIDEVNRRIRPSKMLSAARVKKVRDVIDAILEEAAAEAYGNTEKQILQDFFQNVAMKVNERANVVHMIGLDNLVNQQQFTKMKITVPEQHFQIGAKVGDLDIIADIYAHIDERLDYTLYSHWILTHPSFKIVFDWPVYEDTQTVVHVLYHMPEYDAIFKNVLVPAFGIVSESE